MVFLLSSVCFSFLKGLWQVICLILTSYFIHECGLLIDVIFFEAFCSLWWLLEPVFRMSVPFFFSFLLSVKCVCRVHIFSLFVDLSLRPYLLGFFRSLMGLHFCSSLIRDF